MALDLDKLKQEVIRQFNHRHDHTEPHGARISIREHESPEEHALIAAILAVVDEYYQPRPEAGSRFVVETEEE